VGERLEDEPSLVEVDEEDDNEDAIAVPQQKIGELCGDGVLYAHKF